MTREQAIEELKRLADTTDPEVAHLSADGVLIELLRELGYGDVADAWESIKPKWYA